MKYLTKNFSRVLFFLLLLLSSVLLFSQLTAKMMFIGDIGWYYLAARDILITGEIPLVGIPSSHPWLHQGAYWTYLLAIALKLGNFHPASGGVFASILGISTVCTLYYVGKKIFSSRIGLVSAALYATSPLVIVHSRMPYHTTPIPLFTILYFYCLFQWQKGGKWYFPLAILFLAVLYNFEIATLVLVFPLLSLVGYGLVKKKSYVKSLFSLKMILSSLIAFVIPMVPMLIYDFSHGFSQTLKVVMWFGYRILVLFGYPSLHPEIESTSEFLSLSSLWVTRLVFAQGASIAIIILLISLGYFGFVLYQEFTMKKLASNHVILALWLLFGLGGYILNQVPSEAYLPMLFPLLILVVAIFFVFLLQIQKVIVLAMLLLIMVSNIVTVLKNNYYLDMEKGYGASLATREKVLDDVIQEIDGKKFKLQVKGEGSQFESSTMNYQYLFWWKKHPVDASAKTTVVIQEFPSSIIYQMRDQE